MLRPWLFLCLLLVAAPARGQVLVDTVFTWQSYARTATCHLRLYATPASEERPHTVVLREVAENGGPSTTEDARYLAEQIGRQYRFDPASATWIYYWGAFSFAGASPTPSKDLFLRATFRRTKSQALSTPSWKVVSREEVEAYTDRQFR